MLHPNLKNAAIAMVRRSKSRPRKLPNKAIQPMHDKQHNYIQSRATLINIGFSVKDIRDTDNSQHHLYLKKDPIAIYSIRLTCDSVLTVFDFS